MEVMSSRERLLRALRHKEVDFVPCSPRMYDYIHTLYGCHCWMHQLRMAEQFGYDPLIEVSPSMPNYLLTQFGSYQELSKEVRVKIEIERHDGYSIVKRIVDTPAGKLKDVCRLGDQGGIYGYSFPLPHFVEHMIKEEEDFEKLKFLFPAPEKVCIDHFKEIEEKVGERGLVEARALPETDRLLADAVGLENAILFYYDKRDFLKQLIEFFNDYHQRVMKICLEKGVKVIMDPWFNTSVSAGWSPAIYEELFLPLVKKNVKLVHSYGAYYHYYDDGKWTAILKWVADAGVDLIDTLAPPPLGDIDLRIAKEQVGNRVCLKGNVDQVNLIWRGRPSQVKGAVRKAIEVAAPGGGFILSTADSMRPETPRENMESYFQAWREFGKR